MQIQVPSFSKTLNPVGSLSSWTPGGAAIRGIRSKTEKADSSLEVEREKYRFAPAAYIREKLGWEPWSGTDTQPGQQQVLDAYALALRQQHERRDFENGKLTADELKYWQPGQVIQNWLSVDAGHTVGKTFLAAGIVSHFFDNFAPSITYCFAPTSEQINDLLFKDIRAQREGKGLPGRVLEGEPRIAYKPNHFVKGKATKNDRGTGTERAQGQHGEYLLFVLDEAEGIEKFVFDAVKSMSSGGICIVLILRNPRTTVCPAHKVRRNENCKAFRISCAFHPNVVADREIVPGAVRRQFVLDMLPDCEIVNEHCDDDYTFELAWQPGVIYRPSLEFLWRILGIASAKGTDNTFCPPGRYEAACKREGYDGDDPATAYLGVDAARYGNDTGTIYCRHAGTVRKEAEIKKQDGYEYYIQVKEVCKKLKAKGVKTVHVRVDAGGGYGSTCIDNLNRDADVKEWFLEFKVFEVHNNGTPSDPKKYSNLVTEMYANASEALQVLRLATPSPNLETDLCERKYKYVIKSDGAKTRLDLKELVSKEAFKADYGRSPDDGDGFVLAVASERLFKRLNDVPPASLGASSKWRVG